MAVCRSAETGRTLFLFVALVLLFALPLLKFKFQALLALYSVLRNFVLPLLGLNYKR